MTRSCLFALACWLTFGCAVTETGNPNPKPTKVTLAVQSSAPDQVGVAGSGAPLTVNEYYRQLSLLRFERCTTESVTLVSAITTLDLLSDDTSALLEDLPSGEYCSVVLNFALAGAEAEPSDLLNQSLLMRGDRSNGSRYQLVANSVAGTTLVPADGSFVVSDDQPPFLVFDIAPPVISANVADEPADFDGVARVQADLAMADFEANLVTSITLRFDSNANGVFDNDDALLAAPE
jgi:hypothetical protein